MAPKHELLDVDPSTLIIGTNIRRRPRTDDLIPSLKANGMLQPILAERTDDGITVVDGQRRTLAAIEAGLKSVPVLVTAKAEDKMRLAAQFVSNEHRQALDAADRADAVRELALFGMSAAQIQKRTGLDKDVVSTLSKIPASTTEAVREVGGTFDLDTLTHLAEIDGEPEHAAALEELKALPEDADPYDREWILRSAAQQVRRRKAIDAGRAEFTKKFPDVTILDAAPAYDSPEYVVWHQLETVDGEALTYRAGESIQNAREAFGTALRVRLQAVGGYGDSEYQVRPTCYAAVADLETAGLRLKPSATVAVKTDEDVAAEKADARAARESAKAWSATADDRRTFLATICGKKTLPAGWEQFTLAYVFSTPTTNYWSPTKAQAVAMLLGLDQLNIDTGSPLHSRNLILAEIQNNQPHRATHAMLAAALAEIEEGQVAVGNVIKPFESHGHHGKDTPTYLDQLEAWGYDAKAERALLPEVTA